MFRKRARQDKVKSMWYVPLVERVCGGRGARVRAHAHSARRTANTAVLRFSLKRGKVITTIGGTASMGSERMPVLPTRCHSRNLRRNPDSRMSGKSRE